jgi:hypothetical protein
MPRKIWAELAAAWIQGIWLAEESPRQLTPVRNPSGSSGRVGFRSWPRNWFTREICLERAFQPFADGFAISTVGSEGVFVAQEIVPEGKPVAGVVVAMGEQLAHQAGSLIAAAICRELGELLGRRDQSPDIEIDPARIDRIGDRGNFDVVSLVISGEKVFEGSGWFVKFERRNKPGLGRGSTGRRPGTLIDPGPQSGQFSVSVTAGPAGGIIGCIWPVIRWIKRLSWLAWGMMTAPLRPHR